MDKKSDSGVIVMQLPEGWQLESIYDLCDFTRGLTYKKTDEIDFSSQVVLRANNISLTSGLLDFSDLRYINESVKIDNSKIIKKDSLLICTASGSKSHLGKVALIDKDYPYAFGGFMGLITPKDIIDSRYLYWFTQSKYYKDYIAALTDGANINNLKFSQLKLCYIPFPKKNKQKRIVAILDEAFAGISQAIANTEKNLANARELFERLLTKKLDKIANLPPTQTLTDLTELIIDCEHKTAPTQSTGYPSIRTPNIGKGDLLLDDVYKVSQEIYEIWTKRLFHNHMI